MLIVDSLCAAYGSLPVLREVSLSVEPGEVVALIGPSGSGKSSLLRSLIGLNKPTGGQVMFDGVRVDYGSAGSLKAARRRMAIVFQQYNLFQNMTALANVTVAPIEVQRRSKSEARADGLAALAKVGLADKINAYPDELSGGQQQRVAIARALVLKPDLLLLDEVTAALDPELVGEVLETISTLADGGMTMLIVSHEMRFVREVADRVVMMDQGRIVEIGPPDQLFESPQSERAKAFMAKVRRT